MSQYLSANSLVDLTVASAVSAACHVDGVTFLHAGTGRLFATNRVGARVWDALRCHLPLCEIVTEIAREYALAPSTVGEHMEVFLTELVRHRLVEPGTRR